MKKSVHFVGLSHMCIPMHGSENVRVYWIMQFA